MAYHFYGPLGVVAQIIPWNFPLLMACWKMAPALAAGNCIVLKSAKLTPLSVLVLMELIQDLLLSGVVNAVNGTGGDMANIWRPRDGWPKLPLPVPPRSGSR